MHYAYLLQHHFRHWEAGDRSTPLQQPSSLSTRKSISEPHLLHASEGLSVPRRHHRGLHHHLAGPSPHRSQEVGLLCVHCVSCSLLSCVKFQVLNWQLHVCTSLSLFLPVFGKASVYTQYTHRLFLALTPLPTRVPPLNTCQQSRVRTCKGVLNTLISTSARPVSRWVCFLFERCIS